MTVILVVVAILVVLFLPGSAWLAVARPRRLDPLEWIIEAAGASLALTGLAALYLFLVGIQLSAAGMVGLYLAVLVIGVAASLQANLRLRLSSGLLLGVAAVLGLIAWRLYQAGELALPAWVDSVHHVLLVRKIVEFGGLPPDWQPYLPVPMFYHYGFHVLAAAFTFWSGQTPDQAVLLFGQVVNAMAGLSVYRLAKAAWGDTLRAILAVLLTAFAFHMPAYYLSWGRYPLLAGIVVLPLAMAAALEVRRDASDWTAWARLGLYTAAACFCHFLAVGLLGLFFLGLLGAECVRIVRERRWKVFRWQPFIGAAIGALLAGPWLWRVWSYTHQSFSINLPETLITGADASGLWEYLAYLTGPQRSHIILGLSGLGLVFGLIHGRARLLATWGLMMAVLATPYGPRFNPFRPDHLAILLFLPGSLLLAELIVSTGEALNRLNWLAPVRFYRRLAARLIHSPDLPGMPNGKAQSNLETSNIGDPPGGGAEPTSEFPGRLWRRAFSVGLPTLVGLLMALWGIWETRSIINPVTVLATSADRTAIEWVQHNTLAGDRFFINSTPWMGNIYRGVDGGYWLLTLTGRFAVVPPLPAGWGDPQDWQRSMNWARRASEVSACDEKFWSLVTDAHLNFAYVRLGVGSLQPASLDGCPGVSRIYNRDGVSIYQIRAP